MSNGTEAASIFLDDLELDNIPYGAGATIHRYDVNLTSNFEPCPKASGHTEYSGGDPGFPGLPNIPDL